MNSNTPQLPPGFVVLHGNRTEDLRDLLTGIYKAQPLPPLWSEVILVQSNGMKHWLELELADDNALGICAATRLELPSKYMWQIYRSVLGADKVPKHMPFDKDSLVWRLYRMLPNLVVSNPVYQPLQHYLKQATDGRKLYQLATQVADVLDAYQNYRADWLADWSMGHDVLQDGKNNAVALDADLLWQAQLWRDVSEDVGDEWGHASRSSVHQQFMQLMPSIAEQYQRNQKLPYGIPPRITVFGVSSMPMQMVEALAELGRVCQVFVLVQNPCRHYWGDLIEDKFRNQELMWKRHPRKARLSYTEGSALAEQNSNPLLASWGKQGRDYLHLLDKFDEVESYKNRYAKIELFVDPANSENNSALSLLQSAIFNLEPQVQNSEVCQDDNSIELVSTYGAMREVQVLHDKILNWLDSDSSLLPGEIMVMVPDMETFAANIHAVFGKFKRGERRFIPYSVSDASLTQSPLVLALEQILSLDSSRVTLQDCFSMLEVPSIVKRFGLTDSAVEKLKNWLSKAGVKWGLDASHRSQWGINITSQDEDQNTWKFGLNRLILGYALGISAENAKSFVLQDAAHNIQMFEGAKSIESVQGVWQNNLAFSAVSSLDAPVMDGLLAWVEAVSQTILELQHHQTPELWKEFLQTVIARFFAASTDQETALLQKLNDTAQAWLDRCQEANLTTELPIEVVREHYLSQIQEPSIHQRFFGGGVQFATLMPMRSIPFKVLAMLGMNDGQYPRKKTYTDFDLMAKNWRVGDRSRREDDRYLFLEALLAARQKLYISWQGLSAQDNSVKPPSVLVAQLLEYLNLNFQPSYQAVVHPLQPFSSVYFDKNTSYVTYDKDWQLPTVKEQAQFDAVLKQNLSAMSTTQTTSLPTELDIEQLAQYVKQPVEAFFRQRLGIYFEALKEQNETNEPFSLNALEAYILANQLSQINANYHFGTEVKKLELSGALPLAGFKKHFSDELAEKAQTLQSKKQEIMKDWLQAVAAQSYNLELDIPLLSDDYRPTATQHKIVLTGVLQDWYSNYQQDQYRVVETRPGAVTNDKHIRLEIMASMWVNHLFACALGIALSSYKVGLDEVVVLEKIPKNEAQQLLRQLLAAYLDMWRDLPKIACKTAGKILIEWSKNANKTKKENKEQAVEITLTLTELSLPEQQLDEGSIELVETLHEKASAKFGDDDDDNNDYSYSELKESSYLSRVFTSYEDIKNHSFALTDIVYTPLFLHAKILGIFQEEDSKT
jgi:exodeoxyribonuclease V gamma subunit